MVGIAGKHATLKSREELNRFLVACWRAVALAQSASEWDSHAVNAIAAKLNCSCGCKQDIACTMPPLSLPGRAR